MSDIVEILGENKFFGSTNQNLNTRIVFDEEKKNKYETNLFFNISQQTQYLDEKNNCNLFRLYGKINPIINSFVSTKNINGDLISNGVNKDSIAFTENNWSVVILKSKRVESSIVNQQQLYQKGLKNIGVFDFKLGLPGVEYKSKKDSNNYCIFMSLGHNLKVNDRIRLTKIKTNVNIESNIYTVTRVEGNEIYINVTKKDINDKEFNLNLVNDPDYYISKIVNNEVLEYYLKTLEVIDVISNLDNCAFSVNNFSNDIKNYTNNNLINVTDLYDNTGYPITDLYIGIIKNGQIDIRSNFKNLINLVNINDTIEVVANKNKLTPKIGDTFIHSLCEYTTENLTEFELNTIQHFFYHNGVKFDYNPYSKIQLKLKSTYIEDSDSNIEVPKHAVFSRLRNKYIWRDVYNVGDYDDNGLVIDLPYMNNSFYVFNDIVFILKTPTNITKKLELNVNDLTNSNGNITNLGDDLNILDFNSSLSNEIKPYNEYIDIKC